MLVYINFNLTSLDRPDEQARIEAAGGRVLSVTYPNGTVGPPRVWLGDQDFPGLSMSRWEHYGERDTDRQTDRLREREREREREELQTSSCVLQLAG